MLHVRVLLVRTQFTFRQRKLSLGRCEHKLDTLCPLHTDHLLPTCNYGRFHRTLKSVARSWQYVCCTRVACRSRSAIADLISRCYPKFAPAVKYNQDHIDRIDRHYIEKNTHSDHTMSLNTFL